MTGNRYMKKGIGVLGLFLWVSIALAAPPAKTPAKAQPAKTPAKAQPAKAPAKVEPAKAPAKVEPAKAPAKVEPVKQAAATPSAGKLAVINACERADVSAAVAEDLKAAGYNVVKVSKVPATTEVTRIIYQPPSEKLAQEVSKKILGAQKLVKATTPIPGADVLLTLGCGAAKGIEDAKAKLLKETRFAVINSCDKADASTNVAGDLKAAGYNVVKVSKIPVTTDDTKIIYQPPAEKLAQEVSKKIMGTPKLIKASTPVPGADVLLTLGCGTAQMVVAASQKGKGLGAPPTVAKGLPPRGIFPSSIGGSGLLASHTADVLPFGNYGASGYVFSTFHILPDEYKESGIKSGGEGGLPKKDIDLQMSFNWGIWNRVEAGVMFPVALASGIKSGFGIKNIKVLGRFDIYDNPAKPVLVAATAYVGVPSASSDVGSGDTSGGLEGNVSYLFGQGKRYVLNANLGYEIADYISKAFPGEKYQSEGRLNFSGSLSYLAIEKLLLSAEGIYTSALGKGSSGEIFSWGDDDLFAVLGARYLPKKYIALSIGGGFGIPFDELRDDTNYIILAGASYIFGTTRARAVVVQEAPPKPAAPAAAPAQKPAVAPPPPPPPPPPTAPPPPPPALKKKSLPEIKVDIKDACGKPGVRESVGKALLTGGFNVVKIGEVPKKGTTMTEIMYLKDYESEATMLKKRLKGTPKLIPVATSDMEITVLVGCDQTP